MKFGINDLHLLSIHMDYINQNIEFLIIKNYLRFTWNACRMQLYQYFLKISKTPNLGIYISSPRPFFQSGIFIQKLNIFQ